MRWRQLDAGEHLGLWGCAVLAVASLAGFATDPWAATICLLLSGGLTAVMLRLWCSRAADEASAEAAALMAGTARYDLPGHQRLIAALTALRGRRAADALGSLHTCARSLDGLFFHARRRELSELPEPGDTPLTWALASLHPDGHIREAAVAAMAHAPQAAFAPFLIERAVDHVDAVRTAALAGLRTILTDESARVPVAWSYQRVAGRRHAGALADLLGTPALVHTPEPDRHCRADPRRRHTSGQ